MDGVCPSGDRLRHIRPVERHLPEVVSVVRCQRQQDVIPLGDQVGRHGVAHRLLSVRRHAVSSGLDGQRVESLCECGCDHMLSNHTIDGIFVIHHRCCHIRIVVCQLTEVIARVRRNSQFNYSILTNAKHLRFFSDILL